MPFKHASNSLATYLLNQVQGIVVVSQNMFNPTKCLRLSQIKSLWPLLVFMTFNISSFICFTVQHLAQIITELVNTFLQGSAKARLRERNFLAVLRTCLWTSLVFLLFVRVGVSYPLSIFIFNNTHVVEKLCIAIQKAILHMLHLLLQILHKTDGIESVYICQALRIRKTNECFACTYSHCTLLYKVLSIIPNAICICKNVQNYML